MRVVFRRPGEEPEIREVEGMKGIMELVEDSKFAGSDNRIYLMDGIDLYANSSNRTSDYPFSPNVFLEPGGRGWFNGPIVFVGFDENSNEEYGARSLKDEEVIKCIEYIRSNNASRNPRFKTKAQ